jgi:phosphoenolpyruvate phosphomutase
MVVIDSTLPLPEKDFKARIKDGKVVEIGIDVFGHDCYACQPFYHLHKEAWNAWQAAISDFCDKGKNTVYAEEALNTILETLNLYPLDIQGRFCMEIDNEEDLAKARVKMGNKND